MQLCVQVLDITHCHVLCIFISTGNFNSTPVRKLFYSACCKLMKHSPNVSQSEQNDGKHNELLRIPVGNTQNPASGVCQQRAIWRSLVLKGKALLSTSLSSSMTCINPQEGPNFIPFYLNWREIILNEIIAVK